MTENSLTNGNKVKSLVDLELPDGTKLTRGETFVVLACRHGYISIAKPNESVQVSNWLCHKSNFERIA